MTASVSAIELVSQLCSFMMTSNIAALVVVPASLFYLSKFLWRMYILRSARDPSTDLSHLPIPPGDFGLPIIGETLTWAIQGSDFNLIRRKKHGNVFSSNYIGKTMIKVTGPEYVKQILTGSREDLQTIWPTSVRRVIGETSISNSVGSLHKYRRKIFLRAFTHAALQSYLPRMHHMIKQQMQKWVTSMDTVLVYPSVKRITFEVAFSIIVGLTFKDDMEKDTLFETFDSMITNLFSLPYEFPGSAFSKALKAKNKIHALFDDHLLKKRQKVRRHIEDNEFAASSCDESLKNAMHYVLESLILDEKRKQNGRQETEAADDVNSEEEHEVTDTELKETTTEMLFAGYQTVASSESSAILNLIKYPKYFHKIEEELRDFGLLDEDIDKKAHDADDLSIRGNGVCSGEHSKSDINCNVKSNDTPDVIAEENITLEKLNKLNYLEQVMKETLRINPPILGGYRQATRTFQLGKYRVPKGWTIIYNIRDTHEAEWEDDREFNPDRFSPDNWQENKESKFRWIPFGGGPRICVGREFARMQFKLFLIEFVRTFRNVEFADGKPPKLFAIPFLHPTNGLPVKLYAREPHQTVEVK